jgi:phage terminase small subunit
MRSAIVPGVKGRSGRPRLSAAEHQLRGTYRTDRHGPLPPADLEVASPDLTAPGDSVMAPPADLTTAERAYWAYFAPLLASARALAPADRDTLADYCRACAAVVDRNRRLAWAFRQRPIEPSTVRMLDAQVRGWIEKKTRLAMELGLTAVARSRIKWTGHAQAPPPVAARAERAPRSTLATLQEQAAALRRPVGVKR